MAVQKSIARMAEDAFLKVIKNMAGGDLAGFEYFKGFEYKEISSPRIEIIAPRTSPNVEGPSIIAERSVTIHCGVCTHYIESSREMHAKAESVIERVFLHDGLEPDNPELVDRLNNVSEPNFCATIWIPGDITEGINQERKERQTIFTGVLECLRKLV